MLDMYKVVDIKIENDAWKNEHRRNRTEWMNEYEDKMAPLMDKLTEGNDSL